MKINTNEKKIRRLLTRGVTDVVPKGELEKQLAGGKRLRLYNGVDPTGFDLHIGHAVVLRKLREFQDLGHEVILLFGDFTAMIGDPTDRDEMRKALSREQVLANAKTYKKQASKILSFSSSHPNPVKILWNSKWLGRLTFADVVELASNFTVQQMLERDMFEKRMKEGRPIHLNEFMYPLMQGYDSVHMDVDLEVGGNDQLFNMLAGRTLMEKMGKKSKSVLTTELLEGTDGRKMSKTYGNYIGLTEKPEEMYGKVMSMKDELITRYFLLATDTDEADIKEMEKDMKAGANPRDFKMRLATELVTMYHSKVAAKRAEAAFRRVFQRGGMPTDMPEKRLRKKSYGIIDMLMESGLVSSRGEGRRVIQQGGVKVDGRKVTSVEAEFEIPRDGLVLQKGKRHFVKLL